MTAYRRHSADDLSGWGREKMYGGGEGMGSWRSPAEPIHAKSRSQRVWVAAVTTASLTSRDGHDLRSFRNGHSVESRPCMRL